MEVLDLVPRRDRDALHAEPHGLFTADGPELGRADEPVGADNPEPGYSLGLLGREPREGEGNLTSRDVQVLTDGPYVVTRPSGMAATTAGRLVGDALPVRRRQGCRWSRTTARA